MEIYLKNQNLREILKNVAPNDIIYLEPKVYNEKIKITVPNITIIGHKDGSSIEYNDHFNTIGENNQELMTVRTYTLMVAADNVTIKNLTIKNTATPSEIYGQAVALHILGDNFKAENLKILGAQDTLLCGPIPHDLTLRYQRLLSKDELTQKKSHQFYKDCYIEGDIDFIFGCGIAYFLNCELHSIKSGYVTAPAHPKEYEFGFVFENCKFTSSSDDFTVFLSRPWRDFGQCAILNSTCQNHISPKLFNNWQKGRENTCRFSIYNTYDTKDMVNFAKKLSENDTKKYTKENILNS